MGSWDLLHLISILLPYLIFDLSTAQTPLPVSKPVSKFVSNPIQNLFENQFQVFTSRVAAWSGKGLNGGGGGDDN